MASVSDNVIDAPGEVALAVHPAGVGSRFIAALLDHLILAGLMIMVAFMNVFSGASPTLLITGGLLLYAGWFVVLEALTGRTFGKAAVDLCVVRENGEALDIRGSLVRNLIRISYVIPVTYVIEVLLVALDRRNRRLGDLLAGTVVIGERHNLAPTDLILRVPPREQPRFSPDVLERATPTADEYQALRTFCFRTRTLSHSRRRDLARRLLAPLYERAGLEVPAPAEQEELLVDLMHHINGTFGARPRPRHQ